MIYYAVTLYLVVSSCKNNVFYNSVVKINGEGDSNYDSFHKEDRAMPQIYEALQYIKIILFQLLVVI